MIMITHDTATKLNRRLWVERWADRLHAAQTVVLWLNSRPTEPPTDPDGFDRNIERLNLQLQCAVDHFCIARAAPTDNWLPDARDCERVYTGFVRDTNRALARFK